MSERPSMWHSMRDFINASAGDPSRPEVVVEIVRLGLGFEQNGATLANTGPTERYCVLYQNQLANLTDDDVVAILSKRGDDDAIQNELVTRGFAFWVEGSNSKTA
ncbi:hypothetical protein [uncultured Sphingomonas sp.]|uniref:hypothetical protein n=1 Tax=uncultured Sphingomonas sp. TaxID=158754 RepID=UPI0025F96ECA|nr:hypothetical protein [uncultured Sphingomonas sp.]